MISFLGQIEEQHKKQSEGDTAALQQHFSQRLKLHPTGETAEGQLLSLMTSSLNPK